MVESEEDELKDVMAHLVICPVDGLGTSVSRRRGSLIFER